MNIYESTIAATKGGKVVREIEVYARIKDVARYCDGSGIAFEHDREVAYASGVDLATGEDLDDWDVLSLFGESELVEALTWGEKAPKIEI